MKGKQQPGMILRAAVAYALVELASAILNGTDKPKRTTKRKKRVI